jgi:hypothetical protein
VAASIVDRWTTTITRGAIVPRIPHGGGDRLCAGALSPMSVSGTPGNESPVTTNRRRNSFSSPHRPAHRDFDHGQDVTPSAEETPSCAGDTALGGATSLPTARRSRQAAVRQRRECHHPPRLGDRPRIIRVVRGLPVVLTANGFRAFASGCAVAANASSIPPRCGRSGEHRRPAGRRRMRRRTGTWTPVDACGVKASRGGGPRDSGDSTAASRFGGTWRPLPRTR